MATMSTLFTGVILFSMLLGNYNVDYRIKLMSAHIIAIGLIAY